MKKSLSKYEQFEEAIRLIHKFFPESKSNFSKESGIGIYKFLESVKHCNYHLDVSCDPYLMPSEPDLGLGEKRKIQWRSCGSNEMTNRSCRFQTAS